MGKEISSLQKWYFLNDVNVNISISKKISFSEKNYKYFIGYITNYKIKPFNVILPNTV